MGTVVDPAHLTESGELCLARLSELRASELPPAQLITAIGTAVEAHVLRLLARLIELTGVPDQPLGAYMMEKLEDMTRSWPSRKKLFNKGFSLDYAGDASSQDFAYLIELRNAVVHGDGALSPDQRRKGTKFLVELRRELSKRLDVDFKGRTAAYGPNSSHMALSIARLFVADFDRPIMEKYPDAQRL